MDINTSKLTEYQDAEKSVRKPYHPPELVNLGHIQSVVQTGTYTGNDGDTNTNACANS